MIDTLYMYIPLPEVVRFILHLRITKYVEYLIFLLSTLYLI